MTAMCGPLAGFLAYWMICSPVLFNIGECPQYSRFITAACFFRVFVQVAVIDDDSEPIVAQARGQVLGQDDRAMTSARAASPCQAHFAKCKGT
jgi:hypothetical protein